MDTVEQKTSLWREVSVYYVCGALRRQISLELLSATLRSNRQFARCFWSFVALTVLVAVLSM